MEGYDEDLSENPYFIRFQNQHPQLYETATGSRWIVSQELIESFSLKYVYITVMIY